MSTTTTDLNITSRAGNLFDLPVLANAVLPKGSIVLLTAAGYADIGADTALTCFAGIADENVTGSSISGGKTIRVRAGEQYALTLSTTPALTDVGNVVYIADNQTVTLTAGLVRVGRICGLVADDSTKVWVQTRAGLGPMASSAVGDITWSQNDLDLLNQLF